MAPSVLALIGSPYQALGLLEYVRTQGITKGSVFLPIQDDPAMLRPSMNALIHLRGFTFHLRRATGYWQPGVHTGTVAEGVVAIGREKNTIDTVVIGDYRDTMAWRVASLLHRTGPNVVVLDDGAATLAIDRSQGGFAPLEWSEEAERGGFMPQKAVTFFTSMPDSLQAAPGDTIVPNNWTWLKSRYRDLRRSASLVLVIGQGFSRGKLMEEQSELELAYRLVDTARQLHPGGNVLYVAHRAESVSKLRAMSRGVPRRTVRHPARTGARGGWPPATWRRRALLHRHEQPGHARATGSRRALPADPDRSVSLARQLYR